MRRTVSFSANYYVLCLSNEHDRRLFEAFPTLEGAPADACVIVWDVDEFARRLEMAAIPQLKDWLFHHNPVSYFDPYDVRRHERISPGMSKDFLYAYQREYRFLWLPPSGVTATEALFIELGCLADIAGLYRADGSLIRGRGH